MNLVQIGTTKTFAFGLAWAKVDVRAGDATQLLATAVESRLGAKGKASAAKSKKRTRHRVTKVIFMVLMF